MRHEGAAPQDWNGPHLFIMRLGYLRKMMTKLCIKIHMKSGSAI